MMISSSLLLIPVFELVGQEKVIQGMVTTFDSIPLINATIEVKSNKERVFTDTLGIFSVTCASKDKLKVAAGGFLAVKRAMNI